MIAGFLDFSGRRIRSNAPMTEVATNLSDGPSVPAVSLLPVHPRSERQFVTRGVTKFVLHADRYEWQFTDVTGVVRDSGSQACRVSAA